MIEKLKKIKEENKATRDRLKNNSNSYVLTIKDGFEKLEKIKDVVNEWNKGKYPYSNNHMCEIKNILA